MVYHPPMSREDPQMKIRLPADLKEEIEAAAKQSGRSMNAEIVARLEGSFGLKPDISKLHPVEAVYKAHQLRQSISSLQTEIASLSTQKATLQNILGNTHLVAKLVKTDEALHASALEVENLDGLIRNLGEEIAIRMGTKASMEAELYELDNATPELFNKLKKSTNRAPKT